MRLIRLLLRYSRREAALAFLAAVASGAANAALLAIINQQLAHPSRAAWAPAFFGLLALTPLARVLSAWLLARLGQQAVHDLRMELSRRILLSPLDRLETVASHRLNAAVTQDISTIANTLGNLPLLVMHGAIVVGALGYLAWLSWRTFAVLLAFLALGAATYQAPLRIARRRHEQSRERMDTVFRHYREVIQGTKELKMHRPRRQAFLAMLQRSGAVVQRLNVSILTLYDAAASWGQTLTFLVVGLMLFAAPVLLPGLAPRQLVGYTLIVLYLMNPLGMILDRIADLMRADVALQKVERLGLSLAAEEVEPPAVEEPEAAGEERPWSELALAGVRYTYRSEDGESFRLGPIDLALIPGELVFIAGGNGSGKTTLAKLILGLYQPDGGEIRWNGIPLTAGSVELYRQQFSVVFSDFYLFESLLGLAAPRLDERAADYLRLLRLDRKLEVRDGELSTTELSQGQRKRLAMLTACLEDRPIYLFDEWAADQDPIFKRVFYDDILPGLKRRGKTVLVISHDDSYYRVADRIIKLESGRIVCDQRSERVA